MSHSKLFEISHLHSPNKTSHPSWKINQRNTQLLLEKNLCTHELKLTLKKQMLTHGDVCINLSCLVWLDRPKPSMCLVAQLCWTHYDPMDSSPPGSSVRGDSLGKNTGVGSLSLLKGIFPTQGLNPGLPHYSQILYCLSHREAPKTNIIINYRRNIIVLFVIHVKTHLFPPQSSHCWSALTKLEMNSGPCIKGDFPYKLNIKQALFIISISVSLCLSFVLESQ